MLSLMTDIKQQEYELLNEIAQDSLVTQASLAKRLGIAVHCRYGKGPDPQGTHYTVF